MGIRNEIGYQTPAVAGFQYLGIIHKQSKRRFAGQKAPVLTGTKALLQQATATANKILAP
ncbi:MAG: hypothetical protein SwBeaMacB_29050 [Shewanella algae]|uniref:Uncharacterized protein n=1 Tax=Shewanella algae TaxID=38313 RepID=A0AAD1KBT2_9GAMM|nr:hypothetical protein TUM4442_20210 [Shewanella algae]BCV40795.1 hypothetical protein TUM17378_20570 [Shewanella algae]BCV45072.1 hypothetical protein TUM17379_20900 [Shewanella algae]BCV49406.1 hypothetical protein TUM17382_20990 [Shewanella algae]BCV53825.1 hypothetical protein TUM17383_20720 [Shewanella algae]